MDLLKTLDAHSAVLAIAVTILLWYLRGWKSNGEKTADILAEHVKECNKVPKVLILEKVENMNDKFDEFKAASAEFRQRMYDGFKELREKQ